jgi:hypothetical protein
MVGLQESTKATAVDLRSLTRWQVLVSNLLKRTNSRFRVALLTATPREYSTELSNILDAMVSFVPDARSTPQRL